MLQELSHMDRITQLQNEIENLLTIMSASIKYLCSRTNFRQVSEAIPITKQRNAERVDTPEEFEKNKKELVDDLVKKAKQVEILIQSLPVPESEEIQARRLQDLEDQMQQANADYIAAVERARDLHSQISEVLKGMLCEAETSDGQPEEMILDSESLASSRE